MPLVNTRISINCNIIELTSVGIHLHYRLKIDDTEATQVPSTGFTILMQNTRKFQLHLPTFPQPEKEPVDIEEYLPTDPISMVISGSPSSKNILTRLLTLASFAVSTAEIAFYRLFEVIMVLVFGRSNSRVRSAQWLRLQFWPKNPNRLSSLQFTGLLPLKFMVQTRQLRASHPDIHYASALFRYEKEFSVKFRKITNLVFLDDKHRWISCCCSRKRKEGRRLQSVGLMRAEMDDESEKLISKCGTMNEILKIAMENPTLGEDFIDSLQSPICLEWRNSEKQFNLWTIALPIAEHIKQRKCGESTCTIYRPSRCLPEDFEQLYRLPDPSTWR
ncbi:hypothetical protein RhiirA1_523393 [Rhizophagus irregularis]|uniref:Uncharacterized protein n=1 Tax=Rhizophagus irregularis TaxID=588596 RepID=A0A2I1E9B0_9GLOM|nr:hypothetical protein RhiirA1_523393 [Rhizophagus irregularis]PKY18683.1 hypothetical protein RhiirB3_492152 [Rhizophagus irregularis]